MKWVFWIDYALEWIRISLNIATRAYAIIYLLIIDFFYLDQTEFESQNIGSYQCGKSLTPERWQKVPPV